MPTWKKTALLNKEGAPQTLPLDSIIAVGFGSSHCMKDRELVYDEQDAIDEQYATCRDMEKLALADPDHDWRISYYGPLSEAVYQRQGPGMWMLIEKGSGFA